jgi:nitroimidazol reductase NimA-like FMN-containing flavoprotein (pyridoxamine 5'-phosphate oxidase superfamily)
MTMDLSMSPERLAEFLGELRYVAVSSLKKSGAPFTVPTGYLYRDGCIYLSIGGTRPMIKRFLRDPRVCLTIFDSEFPPSYAIIEGRAEPIDDPNDEISIHAMRRYMSRVPGLDLDKFEKNWTGIGRTVFRVTFDKVNTRDGRKVTNLEEDGARPIEVQRRD